MLYAGLAESRVYNAARSLVSLLSDMCDYRPVLPVSLLWDVCLAVLEGGREECLRTIGDCRDGTDGIDVDALKNLLSSVQLLASGGCRWDIIRLRKQRCHLHH